MARPNKVVKIKTPAKRADSTLPGSKSSHSHKKSTSKSKNVKTTPSRSKKSELEDEEEEDEDLNENELQDLGKVNGSNTSGGNSVKVDKASFGPLLAALEEMKEKAGDTLNELAEPMLHKLEQGLAPTRNGPIVAHLQ